MFSKMSVRHKLISLYSIFYYYDQQVILFILHLIKNVFAVTVRKEKKNFRFKKKKNYQVGRFFLSRSGYSKQTIFIGLRVNLTDKETWRLWIWGCLYWHGIQFVCLSGCFFINFGLAIGDFHHRWRHSIYINWVYFEQMMAENTQFEQNLVLFVQNCYIDGW